MPIIIQFTANEEQYTWTFQDDQKNNLIQALNACGRAANRGRAQAERFAVIDRNTVQNGELAEQGPLIIAAYLEKEKNTIHSLDKIFKGKKAAYESDQELPEKPKSAGKSLFGKRLKRNKFETTVSRDRNDVDEELDEEQELVDETTLIPTELPQQTISTTPPPVDTPPSPPISTLPPPVVNLVQDADTPADTGKKNRWFGFGRFSSSNKRSASSTGGQDKYESLASDVPTSELPPQSTGDMMSQFYGNSGSATQPGLTFPLAPSGTQTLPPVSSTPQQSQTQYRAAPIAPSQPNDMMSQFFGGGSTTAASTFTPAPSQPNDMMGQFFGGNGGGTQPGLTFPPVPSGPQTLPPVGGAPQQYQTQYRAAPIAPSQPSNMMGQFFNSGNGTTTASRFPGHLQMGITQQPIPMVSPASFPSAPTTPIATQPRQSNFPSAPVTPIAVQPTQSGFPSAPVTPALNQVDELPQAEESSYTVAMDEDMFGGFGGDDLFNSVTPSVVVTDEVPNDGLTTSAPLSPAQLPPAPTAVSSSGGGFTPQSIGAAPIPAPLGATSTPSVTNPAVEELIDLGQAPDGQNLACTQEEYRFILQQLINTQTRSGNIGFIQRDIRNAIQQVENNGNIVSAILDRELVTLGLQGQEAQVTELKRTITSQAESLSQGTVNLP